MERGSMDIVSFASHPTTWAIYIIAIVGFLLLSLWKFKFTRDTWTNFFQFMFGVGAFLAGIGFGFQVIGHRLGVGINLDYSIESIITLTFMALYVFLAWKFIKVLFDKPGWKWLGIVAVTYGLGCVANALLTGARYLPFVGWFT